MENQKSDSKKLLLATHNKAKLGELTLGIAPLTHDGIIPVSLRDVSISEDPEETGATFGDNAVIKAKYYAGRTGLPTIADDGGLTIDVLQGEPGVHSKRWLGRDAQDLELIEYTLKRLRGVPDKNRTASLQTTLCYFNPKTGALFTETGKISGSIARKSSSNPRAGYPYRALFIVDAYGKYYDELSPQEHAQINHRLQALSRLVKKIKTDLVE
jgi:XTP/dITP diphosphohydrolase